MALVARPPPTRAALLTGRNSHAVGMRTVANLINGFPNGRGRITRRAATLAEIRRVLKAGASLHLLDFVRAHGTHSKTEKHGLLVHRGGAAAERIEGRMTAIMDEAGFVDAKEVSQGRIFFGPIAYYSAQNPGGQPA